MSIIIKGVRMPIRCFDCPMNVRIHNDTEWCCNFTGDTIDESQEFRRRPDWCPLEEAEDE